MEKIVALWEQFLDVYFDALWDFADSRFCRPIWAVVNDHCSFDEEDICEHERGEISEYELFLCRK